MRDGMPKSMRGYIHLSGREQPKALEFCSHPRQQIAGMNEGESDRRHPVIFGLAEQPRAGCLAIPSLMTTRQMRDTAVRPAGLTDREWKIWDLHCTGSLQLWIATKLGIDQSVEESTKESMQR